MIRQHLHCDECNAVMDYGWDFEHSFNGYTIKGALDISVQQKQLSGSSTWPLPSFGKHHFCSTGCLHAAFSAFLLEILKAGKVEPLEPMK